MSFIPTNRPSPPAGSVWVGRSNCRYDAIEGTIIHDAGFMSEKSCQCQYPRGMTEETLTANFRTANAAAIQDAIREYNLETEEVDALNAEIARLIANGVDYAFLRRDEDKIRRMHIDPQHRRMYNIVRELRWSTDKKDNDGGIYVLKKKTYVNPPDITDVLWKYAN
jgi:hypothetical protein